MSTEIETREGPWTDDQGRACLGTWAEEGGQLVILRRDAPGRISIHLTGPGGEPTKTASLSSFRWERVREFFKDGK